MHPSIPRKYSRGLGFLQLNNVQKYNSFLTFIFRQLPNQFQRLKKRNIEEVNYLIPYLQYSGPYETMPTTYCFLSTKMYTGPPESPFGALIVLN
jgi:hypothetical protein